MTESVLCKHCGTPIPAENITDGELAVCDVCSAINNLSDVAPPAKDKGKQRVPDSIHYQAFKDRVEIRYSWYRHGNWAWLVVSMISGFFFYIFLARLMRGEAMWISIFVVSSLALSLLVTISSAIVGLFNHTTIMILDNRIKVSTRPVITDETVLCETLQHIRSVQVKSKSAFPTTNETKYEYQIRYKDKDSPYYEDKVLVSGITSLEEALFIEQEIKRLYQIEHEALQTNVFADSPLEKRKNQQSEN